MRPMLFALAFVLACKDDAPADDSTVPNTDDSTADDSTADDSTADDSQADDSQADDSQADDSQADDSQADDSNPPEDNDQDGYAQPEDCDDTDASVNPGAEEVCNGRDDDCDTEVDVDAVDATTTWWDLDRDGYGDPDQMHVGCDSIEDSAFNGDDCDDTDPSINPDAPEVCDEAQTDEDCDNAADDDDPSVDASTYITFYDDADGDGYGDASTAQEACHALSGTSLNGDDCDDGDPGVYRDCNTSWDGSYTGNFSVTVTVTNIGVSDTCTGIGSFTVDTTQSTPISGTYNCSWAGLGASLLGTQTITLDGTIPSDPSASGNLTVGSVISDTWSGSFSSPGSLNGSFSGTGTYSGYSLSWTGSFSGSR